MVDITKTYVPDSHDGHWIIYVNGVEKSQVPNGDLSEELQSIRDFYGIA